MSDWEKTNEKLRQLQKDKDDALRRGKLRDAREIDRQQSEIQKEREKNTPYGPI